MTQIRKKEFHFLSYLCPSAAICVSVLTYAGMSGHGVIQIGPGTSLGAAADSKVGKMSSNRPSQIYPLLQRT